MKKRTIKLKMLVLYSDMMWWIYGLKYLCKVGRFDILVDPRGRDIIVRHWKRDRLDYEYNLYKYVFKRD